MLTPFTPEPWMADALCAQTDPEIFFPELGSSGTAARKVCGRCPVAARCLQFALEHRETGIWGNTSDRERIALRREEAA